MLVSAHVDISQYFLKKCSGNVDDDAAFFSRMRNTDIQSHKMSTFSCCMYSQAQESRGVYQEYLECLGTILFEVQSLYLSSNWFFD